MKRAAALAAFPDPATGTAAQAAATAPLAALAGICELMHSSRPRKLAE